MILIVGGAYQGKQAFARSLTTPEHLLLNLHEKIRERLSKGEERERIEKEIFAMIGEDSVITADEIGCGVVPMEAFDREYREVTGRILSRVAAKADKVYRVFAGIPTCIKSSQDEFSVSGR